MSEHQCQMSIYREGTFARCMRERHTDGPYCREHGCAKCGHIILADSESLPEPLCPKHYYEAGNE